MLPGGGACEVEVAAHLQKLANETKTKQKFVLEAFAASLLFLPQTLLSNAGFDSVDIVEELRRAHQVEYEIKTKNLLLFFNSFIMPYWFHLIYSNYFTVPYRVPRDLLLFYF